MAAGLTLTNDQTAPRAAREALSEAMAGLPETTRSDAGLLVSELVSNSVVHSPGSAHVEGFVVFEAGIVRVEVSDDSPTTARRGTTSRSNRGFGFGLGLGLGDPWRRVGVRSSAMARTSPGSNLLSASTPRNVGLARLHAAPR